MLYHSLFSVMKDITGHDTRQFDLLHVPNGVLSVRLEQWFSTEYPLILQQNKL